MQLKVEYEHGETAVLKDVVSYQPMPEDKPMNFTEAVNAMKIGNKVRRLSWNSGASIYIYETPGYHWIKWNDSTKAWNPSTEDLESENWWIVT